MTNFAASTLGTWTRNAARITACYLDAEHVRIDNSGSGSSVQTVDEWMRLYDAIRDAGFVRA